MKSSTTATSLVETLLSESHGRFGCFVTPLTDDTNFEDHRQHILQLAANLREEIATYVVEVAAECALEQGAGQRAQGVEGGDDAPDPEEINFGVNQVLKWALQQAAQPQGA